MNKGYTDIVMESFTIVYEGLKYSYVLEIIYINPEGKRKKKTAPGVIEFVFLQRLSDIPARRLFPLVDIRRVIFHFAVAESFTGSGISAVFHGHSHAGITCKNRNWDSERAGA